MLAPAPPPHMLSPTSTFSLQLDDAKQADLYNTLINDLGAVKLEESSSQSDDSADQVVGFVYHDPVGESLGYVGDPTIFTSFTSADEVGQDALDEAKARGVKAKCKHCDAEVASVSMESADDERRRYPTLAAVSPGPSSPRGYGPSIDPDDHSTQVCGVPVGVIEHSATFVDPTRSVDKGKVIELPVETRAAPADHLHRVVEFIVLQLFTALKRILDCPKGQREAVAELLGVALKLLSDSLAIYYAPPGRGKDAYSDHWCNLMNEPNFFPPFIYPLASFVGHLIYALNAPPGHFPSNNQRQPETLPFQFPSSAFTFTADTRGNVGQPDNSGNDGSHAQYSSAPGSTDHAISTQWDAHEHAHSLATSSTAGVVQHQHDTSGGISDAVCITHGAESEFVNEHLVQLAMLIVGLHQTDEALRRRILALCLFPDPNQSTELEGHADLLSSLLKLPTFRYSSDNNKSDTDPGRLPSHVRHHLLSNYLRVQGMGGIMRPSPSRAASTSTTDVLRVIPRTSDEVLSRLARLSWPVSNNRLLENWSLMLQMIRWHAEDKTGAERQAVP
ncbi:hypothetical protein C8Q70DRAFT_473507 [Cubamyces menziesii]|nr:hypothetical protein C8Q70DRAFT_473507 [Cubamyces menziesii]